MARDLICPEPWLWTLGWRALQKDTAYTVHKSIIHKGDPTPPHPTPFPLGPQIDEVEEDVVWVVERGIRIIRCLLLFMTFIEL